MSKRKVCIFTSARSDYGILKPLMYKLSKDERFDLQIIASGMHLSYEFGLTYKEIEEDGFKISEKVEILLSSDTPVAVSKAMGIGLIGFSEVLERLKPDITVVLGDRFETLAFAIASYNLKIPIAHIHGGEVTYGSMDDGYRHAITKLSYLHFTATEVYRKRVIQMGEHPERVFNVGALSLDSIKMTKLLGKKEVENKLGIRFRNKNLLVTFHPETAGFMSVEEEFYQLLRVLDEIEDTFIIFTKSNADYGGRRINRMIDEFVEKHKNRSISFDSMGHKLYISTMKYVDAVVGNSSSGIIEAPYLKVPTVNIGKRQEGRVKAESIVDCEPEYNSIKKAIELVYSPEFRRKLINIKSPYGDGNASDRIIKVLSEFDFNKFAKEFYDLNIGNGEIGK